MSNKIKSVTTYLVSDETNDKGVPSMREERDTEGNILCLVQYAPDGSQEGKTERALDDKARLVEEKHYTSDDVPDQHFKYEYNESGKVARITVFYADGSLSYKNYSRDEGASTTTIDIVDEEGTVEGKEHRRFDSEGKVLEEIIYDEAGAIQEKSEFEYDDHGNIIESVVLDTEGFETVLFYDYHMDDQGRVGKLETLNESEVVIRTDEFEFDERGNRSKHIIQDKNRGYFATDIWEYNQDNLIVHHERLMGESATEVVDLKYRADGLLEGKEVRRSDGVFSEHYEYEFH